MNEQNDLAAQLAASMNLGETPQPQAAAPVEEVPPEPVEEAEGQLETASEAEEREEEEIRSISELMKAIEASPEWFYSLEVPFGDGVEVPDDMRTLGALKDRASKLVQVSQALEQRQQDFEIERNTELARLQQIQVPQEPQELQMARAELINLNQTLQNTDWAKIRESDPTRALALRQELQDSINQLQQQVAWGEQNYQQAMQQHRQHLLQENYKQLIHHIPDLKDPEVYKKAGEDMVNIGAKYGYRPEEIGAVGDHRAIRMLYDLARLTGKDKAAQEAVKKTLKAPKSLRPGAAKQGSKFSRRQLEAIKSKARSPGATRQDKEAAVSAVAKAFGL